MAHGTLLDGIASLYRTGEYSDLKLVLKDETTRNVHRNIVCTQSDFFKNAARLPCKENATGVIALPEDDPEDVECMLQYLYLRDYTVRSTPPCRQSITCHSRPRKRSLTLKEDPLKEMADHLDKSSVNTPVPQPKLAKLPPSPPVEDSSQTPLPEEPDEEWPPAADQHQIEVDTAIFTHVYVYAIASKYFVHGLRELAKTKFREHLKAYIDDPALSGALQAVYTSTAEEDRGLRNIVIHMFRLNPALEASPDVREAIDDTPQLKRELQRMKLGHPVH